MNQGSSLAHIRCLESESSPFLPPCHRAPPDPASISHCMEAPCPGPSFSVALSPVCLSTRLCAPQRCGPILLISLSSTEAEPTGSQRFCKVSGEDVPSCSGSHFLSQCFLHLVLLPFVQSLVHSTNGHLASPRCWGAEESKRELQGKRERGAR